MVELMDGDVLVVILALASVIGCGTQMPELPPEVKVLAIEESEEAVELVIGLVVAEVED